MDCHYCIYEHKTRLVDELDPRKCAKCGRKVFESLKGFSPSGEKLPHPLIHGNSTSIMTLSTIPEEWSGKA